MVKKIFTLALLLLGQILMAQQAPVVPYPPNALNSDEQEMDYEMLWDGTGDGFFNNWHTYRQQYPTAVWTVFDNAPLGSRIQNVEGDRASLLSKKKYTNFDVKFDVVTAIDGNSGVFFRYQEDAKSEFNTRSGPEFQICGGADEDCVEPIKKFGACYGIKAVRPEIRDLWEKPYGQWNQIRIIAYQNHYVHYGNGIKLLEYEIGTNDFLEAYNASKYATDGNHGNYYDIHAGSILLQHHGEFDISFRNLKIKDLGEPGSANDLGNPRDVLFSGVWPDTLPQWYALGKPLPANEKANAFEILSPSALDTIRNGNTYTISWSANISATHVDIFLFPNASPIQIANSIPNTGSFEYTVSPEINFSGLPIQLRIQDPASGLYTDLDGIPSVGITGHRPLLPLTFRVQGLAPKFVHNDNFAWVEIMDIRGNTIKSMPIRSHEIYWNKTTAKGNQAEPGFYLVRFVGDKVEKLVKIVLLNK